jgi:hypothetical protein
MKALTLALTLALAIPFLSPHLPQLSGALARPK